MFEMYKKLKHGFWMAITVLNWYIMFNLLTVMYVKIEPVYVELVWKMSEHWKVSDDLSAGIIFMVMSCLVMFLVTCFGFLQMVLNDLFD